ncbi:MAG TPA: hypothetical protein VLA29_08150 [Acidimicrobiia bacterium]|nr:hypothetical protein [Acidimicrobiia bacterium]
MTDPDGPSDELDSGRASSENPELGGAPADGDVDPGWPWSFLLLVAAGALYLIFRFIELGIELFN